MSLEHGTFVWPRYLAEDATGWRLATDEELTTASLKYDNNQVKILVGDITIDVPRGDVIVLEDGKLSLPAIHD